MIQKPQKLQLPKRVSTADLSERTAEDSENSANSSDSEVKFRVVSSTKAFEIMLLMLLLQLRIGQFVTNVGNVCVIIGAICGKNVENIANVRKIAVAIG